MILLRFYQYILKYYFDTELNENGLYFIKLKKNPLRNRKQVTLVIDRELKNKITLDILLQPVLSIDQRYEKLICLDDILTSLKEKLPDTAETDLFHFMMSDKEALDYLNKVEGYFSNSVSYRKVSEYLFILSFSLDDKCFEAAYSSDFCRMYIESLKTSTQFLSEFCFIVESRYVMILNHYSDLLAKILSRFEDLLEIYNQLSSTKINSFNNLLDQHFANMPEAKRINLARTLFWPNPNNSLHILFHKMRPERISSFITAHHIKMAMVSANELYFRFIPHAWKMYKKEKNGDAYLALIKMVSTLIIESIQTYVFLNKTLVYSPFHIEPKEPDLNSPVLPDELFVKFTLQYTLLSSKRTSLDNEMLHVFAIIYYLFCDPALCVHLLADFDQSLKSAWSHEFPETPISSLAPDYDLFTAGGITWKIACVMPHIKTNGFLNRQIIAFLQQRGLAKKGVKFNSFASFENFSEVVKNGFFFTERNTNPYFLLHGKMSHMIQYIIIILACEKGLISLPEGISYQDLLAATFRFELSRNDKKHYLWSDVFDSANNHSLCFTDPYLLNASLMLSCQKTLPYLSELTTYAFSKGMHKLRLFFNWSHGLNWEMQNVVNYYIFPRVHFAVQSFQGESYSSLDFESQEYEKYLQHKHPDQDIHLKEKAVHRLYTQQYKALRAKTTPEPEVSNQQLTVCNII